MGLDGVELVLEIEEAFGIEWDDVDGVNEILIQISNDKEQTRFIRKMAKDAIKNNKL